MEHEPVSQLVKSTAGVMQEYTQSGGVRPFGVSLLVAGCDADGTPRLYQVDPSGAYFAWKATAIGKVCIFFGHSVLVFLRMNKLSPHLFPLHFLLFIDNRIT